MRIEIRKSTNDGFVVVSSVSSGANVMLNAMPEVMRSPERGPEEYVAMNLICRLYGQGWHLGAGSSASIRRTLPTRLPREGISGPPRGGAIIAKQEPLNKNKEEENAIEKGGRTLDCLYSRGSDAPEKRES